jgi:isocitrate/methylisocitrate lyase
MRGALHFRGEHERHRKGPGMTHQANRNDERIRREAEALGRHWETDARWTGIRRSYAAEEVVRLRGSFTVEHSIARRGAERLWQLLGTDEFVSALGSLTGGQAVECVKAGLKAIYLSGWQVAADANLAAQTYPDQSLYPSNSVPAVVRRINNALARSDQIAWTDGTDTDTYWMAPIVADAEAGFGGALNAFELMKSMIEAGAAGVHYEDQLASEKKCGHLGGKVLVPTDQFIRTLTAARLASDVCGIPTVLVARTDALAATLLTSDADPRDRGFVTGKRTREGYYHVDNGIDAAVARGLAYAPYADMLWCETSTPDLDEARAFAEGIHADHPGKLLAYNCSPSFNWKQHLDDDMIARFQKELAAMGYRFQFITLAGFHTLNASMFELARGYATRGMSAYVDLQQREFALEPDGYTATRHQAEVGTGYFDEVSRAINEGDASTLALEGSTEAEQFLGPEVDRPEADPADQGEHHQAE